MNTSPLHTDFELCYRAVRSRDARFDGRFYTAVTTTGIYCRPICPAQTPLPNHVRFYACAAAAEAAGFRACRRCRPEASPGSADWNVRADLVARALRLIAEGAIDAVGVEGVAQRLGVSARHLHRELVAEVGAGPLALARTRRAQTARLLADQTDLSMTEIAFSAGFASIRQFNETMRRAFGCAPSELRRGVRPPLPSDGAITLRLSYRPPFDAEMLLNFLGQRAIPGVEELVDGRYRRTLLLGRARGSVELAATPGAPSLTLRLRLDDLRDVALVVQRCRGLFDLDADPAAIAAVLSIDPLLASLVARRPGLRIPGAIDGFELAVRAILGQQISVAGARTLAGRLARALGEPLAAPSGGLTHYFPTAAALAEANLDGMGLTGARITALKALARAVEDGRLRLDRSADRAATREQLLALPGVGEWTASYIALRALGDPDALPSADLGLRRALERMGVAGGARALDARAEAWRPWRGYAALHLWTSLGDDAQLVAVAAGASTSA